MSAFRQRTCRNTQSLSQSGVKQTCHFALHMSAFDPKRTSLVAPHMSAFGGEADIGLLPIRKIIGRYAKGLNGQMSARTQKPEEAVPASYSLKEWICAL